MSHDEECEHCKKLEKYQNSNKTSQEKIEEVEKQIKGYISFSGKSPVEVIFSGGVSYTVAILQWSVFVTIISNLIDEAKTENEVCICAAIKMPDGYIVRGHRHSDCYKTILGIKRYTDVYCEDMIGGFMTTKNRFVDRKEGLKLQLAAGIKTVDREGKYRFDELYSEDLY